MGETLKMITGTNFQAEIILNSVSSEYPHKRLTTYKLRYPRIIHAEFMTHRQFSRNASSSRAIPVEKMVNWLTADDIFIPKFRKNQKGMQPGDWLSEIDQREAEQIWKAMADWCMEGSKQLAELGVHKQWANRPLEWFGYINVLATSTEWNNFFALRTEKNEEGWPVPQDEIYELACAMKELYENSTAHYLRPGQWHLPFISLADREEYDNDEEILKKISTARCARLSYLTVEGKKATTEEELFLYNRLLGKHPIHASPAEHQGTPDVWDHGCNCWVHSNLHGNFFGWRQHRKYLLGECL